MNTRWPVQRWVPCTLRLANPINPNWNISVEGYTDRMGNADAQPETLRRSRKHRFELAGYNGVHRTRLTGKDYDSARPVASNETDSGRKKNRRIEIVRM
jgi:OmpA-OmpF porin, OOP family